MTRTESQSLIRDLSKTWVLQRLKHISVSAVPRWIGSNVATATRYEHSLGVGELSLLVSGGKKHDKLLLTAIATLHDIGNGPFPHISDPFMKEILGFTHERAMKYAFDNSPLKDYRVLNKYKLNINDLTSILDDNTNLASMIKGFPDLDNADNIFRFITTTPHRPFGEAKYNPKDIGAIYIGSESHPYAVKPTGTIVGEALGATPDLMVADYEFACKAGTAGIQSCTALVKAEYIQFGLAIGADTSQAAPGDALEYSASAGGAAFIIGSENVIANINAIYSFTTDTPDFWRRAERKYPKHGGRFTGEPAYFKHVTRAAENIMYNTNTTPDDYDYVVFHEPNSKFPLATAKKLGFKKEKVIPSLAVRWIGNTYSASSMIGLAATLDVAKAGDKILMISYGSGSGSDAFTITVMDGIEERRKGIPTVQNYIDDKQFLDYSYYTKHRGKIKM